MRRRLPQLRLTGTIAGLLAVTTLIGHYSGVLSDNWLQTSPWLTVAGTLLGLAAGIWETARLFARSPRA
jgi:F0F1-type ATP synthase assembly protein I